MPKWCVCVCVCVCVCACVRVRADFQKFKCLYLKNDSIDRVGYTISVVTSFLFLTFLLKCIQSFRSCGIFLLYIEPNNRIRGMNFIGFWIFRKIDVIALIFVKLEMASQKFVHQQQSIQRCSIRGFFKIYIVVQLHGILDYLSVQCSLDNTSGPINKQLLFYT